MKVYGIRVEGIALCPLCADPDSPFLDFVLTQTVIQERFKPWLNRSKPIEAICHPGVGLDVEYCERHGTLTLVCHACHNNVAAVFQVAT